MKRTEILTGRAKRLPFLICMTLWALPAGMNADPNSIMFRAVEEGSISDLEVALKSGADVNARSGGQQGETPLCFAANRMTDLVRFLLDHGADPNIPCSVMQENWKKEMKGGSLDRTGGRLVDSPLHRVTTVEVATLLLDRKADPNVKDAFGTTPLLKLTAPPRLPLVRLLLERGASADISDSTGTPLLHMIVAKGVSQQHILDLLPAILPKKKLLDIVPNNGGGTALTLAVTRGFYALAAKLLEAGADPNIVAVTNGRILGGTALGAVFSKTPDTALLDFIGVLLSAGADPNKTGPNKTTPLMSAAMRGWNDAILMLLDHKADVNAQSDSGSTALMEAAKANQAETVRLLLDKGANPALKDKNQHTARDHAQTMRAENVLRYLTK